MDYKKIVAYSLDEPEIEELKTLLEDLKHRLNKDKKEYKNIHSAFEVFGKLEKQSKEIHASIEHQEQCIDSLNRFLKKGSVLNLNDMALLLEVIPHERTLKTTDFPPLVHFIHGLCRGLDGCGTRKGRIVWNDDVF